MLDLIMADEAQEGAPQGPTEGITFDKDAFDKQVQSKEPPNFRYNTTGSADQNPGGVGNPNSIPNMLPRVDFDAEKFKAEAASGKPQRYEISGYDKTGEAGTAFSDAEIQAMRAGEVPPSVEQAMGQEMTAGAMEGIIDHGKQFLRDLVADLAKTDKLENPVDVKAEIAEFERNKANDQAYREQNPPAQPDALKVLQENHMPRSTQLFDAMTNNPPSVEPAAPADPTPPTQPNS